MATKIKRRQQIKHRLEDELQRALDACYKGKMSFTKKLKSIRALIRLEQFLMEEKANFLLKHTR